MRIIPTGLLIVSYFGLTGCTNPTELDESEQGGNVELPASGNPDKNGLDTYKVTHSSLLINKTIATSLVTNPLRTPTSTTKGLTSTVINAICDGTHESLETIRYITKCALAQGTSVEMQCPVGVHDPYKFYGFFGLATSWGKDNGTCPEGGCQEWVSACVLAHSSFAGEIGTSLQISGNHPALSAGHSTDFTDDEGAYWGDIFNQGGAGQKRYGCQGTDSKQIYYSALQGGNKYLMSRVCGYFNQSSSCDFCSGSTSIYDQNTCTGAHSPYLNNLNPAGSPATVRSCSVLCGTDVSADYGYYNSCTTNGTGTASNRVIKVWRK